MEDNNTEFDNNIDVDVDDNDNEEDNPYKNNSLNIVSFNDIKNNIINIKKTTIPFLTKFERARIIGVRLQQLSSGAKPNIDTRKCTSILEIVEKELEQRKTPFIIRRPLPNGTYEDWKMEEFESV